MLGECSTNLPKQHFVIPKYMLSFGDLLPLKLAMPNINFYAGSNAKVS